MAKRNKITSQRRGAKPDAVDNAIGKAAASSGPQTIADDLDQRDLSWTKGESESGAASQSRACPMANEIRRKVSSPVIIVGADLRRIGVNSEADRSQF
jgi:hypothetical protein